MVSFSLFFLFGHIQYIFFILYILLWVTRAFNLWGHMAMTAAGPRTLEAFRFVGGSDFLNPGDLQQAAWGTTAPIEHRLQRAHRGNLLFGNGMKKCDYPSVPPCEIQE